MRTTKRLMGYYAVYWSRQIINIICSGFDLFMLVGLGELSKAIDNFCPLHGYAEPPRGYCDLRLHRGCALGRTDTISALGS